MEFGQWLQKNRGELSLDVLAERSGVSKATLYMVEAGQTDPRLSTARKICKGLRIPLSKALQQMEASRGQSGAAKRAKRK